MSSYRRDLTLRYKYKIDLADYERMLIAQQHKCAICGLAHTSEKPLFVDHSHVTGEIRGLLCRMCNLRLQDDIELLLNAVDYLDSPPARLVLEEERNSNPLKIPRDPDTLLGTAVLTWDEVREIRRLSELGASRKELAEQFNVRRQTIYLIVFHRTWKEQDSPNYDKVNRKTKLTWEQVRNIRKRVAAGEKRRALAEEYGVTVTNIGGIVTGKLWKESASD